MNDITNEIPEGATHTRNNATDWFYKTVGEVVYVWTNDNWFKTVETFSEWGSALTLIAYKPTVGERCEYVAKDGTIIKVVPLFWDGDILVVKSIENSSYFGSLEAKYRAIEPKWCENITTPVKCVVWDDDDEYYWQIVEITHYRQFALHSGRFQDTEDETWKYAQPVVGSITLSEIEAIVRGE